LLICNDDTGTRKQTRTEKPVTINDLLNAIHFLRKISVGQMDVDRLVQTVEALEHEVERRRRKK
jgi:hypothetical protein